MHCWQWFDLCFNIYSMLYLQILISNGRTFYRVKHCGRNWWWVTLCNNYFTRVFSSTCDISIQTQVNYNVLILYRYLGVPESLKNIWKQFRQPEKNTLITNSIKTFDIPDAVYWIPQKYIIFHQKRHHWTSGVNHGLEFLSNKTWLYKWYLLLLCYPWVRAKSVSKWSSKSTLGLLFQ